MDSNNSQHELVMSRNFEHGNTHGPTANIGSSKHFSTMKYEYDNTEILSTILYFLFICDSFHS